MKLEDIGFYTLSDKRAENTSEQSPLWRCELLLTDKCNFNCPYCRGMNQTGDLPEDWVEYVVTNWVADGLKNIRFSGGEPTLYSGLKEIVKYAGVHCDHVAISTNGSASLKFYKELIALGVNDFSISLDACCADFGDKMSGTKGSFGNVVNNIRELSKITYVTTGCVFDPENIEQSLETVQFAHDLGVADIRIISSAQYNETLDFIEQIPYRILYEHPILKYRALNYMKGRNVRGINDTDCHKCHLVKDDMAISGEYHYPCIIHLREGGDPIGKFEHGYRQQRLEWFEKHNSYKDPICRKNCLDVCVDYNNKCEELER